VLGTAEPLGTTDPTGATGLTMWSVTGPKHHLSLKETWTNEIHKGNIGLIKWWRQGSLGLMGPLIWSLNPHNCHPEAILSVLEHGRCITRHGGGPDAPINSRAGQNRPRSRPATASGAMIRGVQGERRHIQGLTAPSESDAPGMWPPALHRPSLPIKATSHSLD
jgi:hypothetical protein